MPGRARPKKSLGRSAPAKPPRRWSQHVTETGDALDLEHSVFNRSAREIARPLKRSADASARRKSSPFRLAMSMLNFYENRAGKNLSRTERRRLDRAKDASCAASTAGPSVHPASCAPEAIACESAVRPPPVVRGWSLFVVCRLDQNGVLVVPQDGAPSRMKRGTIATAPPVSPETAKRPRCVIGPDSGRRPNVRWQPRMRHPFDIGIQVEILQLRKHVRLDPQCASCRSFD